MIARVKVLKSSALTPSCHLIRVEKPAGFTFRPVQFCGLEFQTSAGPEEYPMSLACSPTKDHLEFGARISDSPWKRAFAALMPGDTVEVDGAYGHFVLDETRDAMFIAGGIGITPLKGMAEYMMDTRSPRQARLLFSNKDESEIVFRDELALIERANPNFRVTHTLTREPAESGWAGHRGRIDRALIEKVASGLDTPTWYVCGKPEMVRGTIEILEAMGVPRERMLYELFPGYP